jgi:drug/metabolite transporter (DMT)-like permease
MQKKKIFKNFHSFQTKNKFLDFVWNKFRSIGLAIFATILIGVYQILWKIGMINFELNFISLITNYPLILGFILYGFAAIIILFALKKEDVTIIVPILGLSYFIVTIYAFYFFNETLNLTKIIGMITLFIGVIFVGGGK